MFDSHTHLQKFDAGVLPAVMNAAFEAGITAVSCCAVSPEDWVRVSAVASEYPQVMPSYGVHPWCAGELPENWSEKLLKILQDDPAAGVGEAGLDFLKPDHELQERVFETQLEMAVELGRRITIHCVKAHGKMTEILSRFCGRFRIPSDDDEKESPSCPYCLLHSLSCSAEILAGYLKLGACVSIGLAVVNPRNARVRELAVSLPEERLFFETDSPGGRGYSGGPADLPRVAACVRALRGGS